MKPRAGLPVEPILQGRDLIVLACVAVLVAIVYGWIALADDTVSSFSDSIDYLFLADFYRAAYGGATQLEALEQYRGTRYPPLFPIVLALSGAGTHAPQLAQIVNCALGGLLILLLWLWARQESGDRATASVVALGFGLSPGFFLLMLSPVSEPLAMLLVWAVLWRVARGGGNAQGLWLIATVVGCSTLARSSNIAFVCAFVAWMWLQPIASRTRLICAALALLPFAIWALYRRLLPGAESYFDALQLDWLVTEMGGWPQLLYLQPGRLLLGAARNWNPALSGLAIACAAALLLLTMAGWLQRLRARRLDALLLLFYLGLLLVWPYPAEAPRLMLFVLPLCLLFATEGLQWALRLRPGTATPPRAALAVAGLALLASASTIGLYLRLAAQPIDAALLGDKREQIYFRNTDAAEALESAELNARVRFAAVAVGAALPQGACVYASMPQFVRLHARVPALPYPDRLQPGVPAAQQLQRCDYYFVAGLELPGYRQRPYHLLYDIAPWADPLFESRMHIRGETRMVAALLQRRAPASP